MKKILTPPTGIVLLIAILIAVGCNKADDPDKPIKYPEKVTIFLKAYEDGEEMKLLMYDSKDETEIVAEEHYADVGPGTNVVWRRAEDSGIRSLKKVAPKLDKGPIFPGEAKTILLSVRLRIRVLDDAPVPSEEEKEIVEKYEIIFKDKKYNKEWSTDPYLRIRD